MCPKSIDFGPKERWHLQPQTLENPSPKLRKTERSLDPRCQAGVPARVTVQPHVRRQSLLTALKAKKRPKTSQGLGLGFRVEGFRV